MSETDEMTLMTVTVTKVLKPDGTMTIRYDTGDSNDSYMDTMAMLEFAKAIVTQKAMSDGEERT